MKILHLLFSGLGGHGNVFFSMVKADKHKELEHVALFTGVEELREEYKQLCICNSVSYNYVKKKPGLDINFYKTLIKQIKKNNPQIIFLHGSTNIIPAKIASVLSSGKKKIIVRETQANELKTKREWAWLKFALRYAHKTVFLSDEYNEFVKKRLYRVYRAKKIAVIPNGIDLEMYKPLEKGITDNIILGMQGRMVAFKDHITLLHAFSIIKQQPALKLKLIIAGDGEYKTVLEEKVKELGISAEVEFTGILDQHALVTFIQSLDIYIHASLGETMSTAIMQAMACKKAIIASDVPGINNMIIQNISGLLVPVKDPESLAAAIEQLISNKELAAKLASNAYRFALENYSNTIMFNRYKQIFIS